MKKLSLLLLLASISCGGGNEATPPSTTPATPSTPSATPADSSAPAASAAPATSASAAPAASGSAAPSGDAAVAWKDMDKKARGKYMRETVMPKMKELFTAYDKKFEKMNCGTCHGSGAADGSFKMPNPQLPVLPANHEGFEALGKKKPEMMKFMAMTVKPEMAKLLGEKEMDPKNPAGGGFACMNCHTMKK